MKKIFLLNVVVLSFITVLFNGCIKDNCTQAFTYTFFQPVYKTTAQVRANIKSNSSKSIQNPGKIYIRGHYIFLNELDKGIHVIDNTNPAQPLNVAFIDIPGNVDMAVKGNTLYADLYTDLITLDITNPLQVEVKTTIENMFPHRVYSNGFYNDTNKIIVDWVQRDTTVVESCYNSGRWFLASRDVFFAAASTSGLGRSSASPVGAGGSMARFAISKERLYTVGLSELNVLSITNPDNPSFITRKEVGRNIETIFPFKNNLFIGSSNGMYIYNITNADNPTQTGQFSHVVSCDPVIADDNYAYVTLRSGTRCQGIANQLEVLKLNNLVDPSLVKIYPMTNPHGLSKDEHTLFICDGKEGLKVYDATNVNNLQLVQQIKNIETYDVIAYDKVALVVAKDGLYQYDYTNPANLKLLSKLTVLN